MNLREFHHPEVGREVRQIQTGDVVTVFEENVKRGKWKMAVVENLIRGRDNVVRGANERVIVKGKPARISRPVQQLYPLEVKCSIQDNGPVDRMGGRLEQDRELLRRNPSRSAAIDSRWKTRQMLDS